MSRRRKKKNSKLKSFLIGFMVVMVNLVTWYYNAGIKEKVEGNIPPYEGNAFVEINDNIPYFEDSEYTEEGFEFYSELDVFGRCGVAYANICQEIMPTEER